MIFWNESKYLLQIGQNWMKKSKVKWDLLQKVISLKYKIFLINILFKNWIELDNSQLSQANAIHVKLMLDYPSEVIFNEINIIYLDI